MNGTIQEFIGNENIMHVAYISEDKPYAFTSFYVYNPEKQVIVFKSGKDCYHASVLITGKSVSGTISGSPSLLPFIKGIQFQAFVTKLISSEDANVQLYTSTYPESIEVDGFYWVLNLHWLKYTDTQLLGFGKKTIWNK